MMAGAGMADVGRNTGDAPALRVSAIDAADEAAWDRFVTNASGAELYHDRRWRDVVQGVFGHDCYYLAAKDERGRVRGVLPLVHLRSYLFGNFLVSVPYFNYGGVLADSEQARSALVDEAAKLARKLGSRHIELRHRDDQQLDLPARDDKVTMMLEVPATEDELWKALGGKLRAQIRRPQKEGATVRVGGAELVPDFYTVFARNMRDLGTPVYPRRFFERILATFASQAKVYVVDLGGKPVAAGIVLSHRDTVELPWASSLREANKVGVNMLLYWWILRDCAIGGFGRFDFGRSTKDSGTYKFKEQWGARPQQLRWHYWLAAGGELPRLNPSNSKYRLAIDGWKRLPLPMANFLGPMIVKSLP